MTAGQIRKTTAALPCEPKADENRKFAGNCVFLDCRIVGVFARGDRVRGMVALRTDCGRECSADLRPLAGSCSRFGFFISRADRAEGIGARRTRDAWPHLTNGFETAG